jgi:Predicted permeases
MESGTDFSTNNKILTIIIGLATLLLFSINILRNIVMPQINTDTLNNFYTIFISIVLEGLPFIIIGALISSFIQIFISEENIIKIIPKNKLMGLFFAAIVGLIFPVCDCAIIPVTRRLIKKGIPTSLAITFMLSVPIVNPIVLVSTYYAFKGKIYMLFARLIFGIIAAMVIGYLIDLLHTGKSLKYSIQLNNFTPSCGCGCHNHQHNKQVHKFHYLFDIIDYTSSETYDTGKLFIIGALISALVQSYIPKEYILSIGQGNLYSIIVMFVLAYILSICSQTDAFIARAFLGQFTIGSVVGFLILGPMLDIKNTLMLTGTFNRKFTIKLIFLIISICFIMAVSANYIIPISLKLLGGV